MKIIEVLSKWNKPGSKWVEGPQKGQWRKEFTGIRTMAMCKVQLDNGQMATRHLELAKQGMS